MIIDRHNYEEYFILYWDNELDPFQKKEVEDFVQANTDLQGEFGLLGKTRFTPEELMFFDNKELLVRTSDPHIDHSNYQEYLLSYVDGELIASDQIELEKFIHSHPTIQSELLLLQSTKFHPEQHIVFPDKTILYRKEKKPVLKMIWVRLSVAAAILIIAGFFTLRLLNTNNATPGNTGDIVKQGKTPSNIPTQSKVKEDQAENIKKDEHLVTAPIIEKAKNNIIAESRSKQDAQQTAKRDNEIVKTKFDANDQIVITVNNVTRADPNVVLLNDLTSINRSTEVIAKVDSDANISFAKDDVTERKSPAFYIENPDGPVKDNGGLKGLLRKATRVFERRTNIQATTDDNKLLVGAFAVSLK